MKLPKQKQLIPLLIGGIILGSAGIAAADPTGVDTSGVNLGNPTTQDVPTSVLNGLKAAQASIAGLDKIALAALAVSLVPMAAMLTLRFLNMVMSRV